MDMVHCCCTGSVKPESSKVKLALRGWHSIHLPVPIWAAAATTTTATISQSVNGLQLHFNKANNKMLLFLFLPLRLHRVALDSRNPMQVSQWLQLHYDAIGGPIPTHGQIAIRGFAPKIFRLQKNPFKSAIWPRLEATHCKTGCPCPTNSGWRWQWQFNSSSRTSCAALQV